MDVCVVWCGVVQCSAVVVTKTNVPTTNFLPGSAKTRIRKIFTRIRQQKKNQMTKTLTLILAQQTCAHIYLHDIYTYMYIYVCVCIHIYMYKFKAYTYTTHQHILIHIKE